MTTIGALQPMVVVRFDSKLITFLVKFHYPSPRRDMVPAQGA